MKAILRCLVAGWILLLIGTAEAGNWTGAGLTLSITTATPGPDPSLIPTPAATPTPGNNPSQPLGVSAPSGYEWSSTPVFDDEMNGSSINTNLWNGDYDGPLYCAAMVAALTTILVRPKAVAIFSRFRAMIIIQPR